MTFTLSSVAFCSGHSIPQKYTRDGADVSPPLEWRDVPEGTRSFALVVEDIDTSAGTWVHWLLFNVPGEERGLPEATRPEAKLPNGSKHGKNSWHRLGYEGPCPSNGMHRYLFRLYALYTPLDLVPGISKEQLLHAMKGHIIGLAVFTGTYRR